ncbi:MAG: hypothetical protein A3F83_09315 [Candidatus Glassbacteria bacterium RIFCSPLOWO2_12_FULL_58_11]|uniref:DUF2029 domain-containing protein n=1 Tax=Candidatus Glassbacteria bacterium RIFCSPLOWO2_12_FULL_58_11 TaxID=1817867 RepID=A0A1F5YT66_9BACT|nr:MAG: hypothetical protein A3F83_09315 [Candidatus Glassbacteria bacterium RIFCSPLOWO2_12_FULL_58_11]
MLNNDTAGAGRRKVILEIFLAGLFIRFLIMPFTLHFDFFVIEYMADLFAWYGRLAFDPQVMPFYFPPVVYLIKAPFMWLACIFSADLSHWLEAGKVFIANLNQSDNWLTVLLDVNSGYPLFRNIFLLKLCQLSCDLLIGWLLLRIAKGRGTEIIVLLLWAFNPVALHSAFAHGGIDIIPALLLTAAFYAAVREKKVLVLFLLILGAWAKIFPALVFIPFVLAAESDTSARLRLLLIGGAIAAVISFLIVYLTGVTFAGLAEGPGEMVANFSAAWKNTLRKGGFGISYALYLFFLFRRKRKAVTVREHLEVFLVPLLLLFTFNPVGFRYWVWISPLIILYLAEQPKVWPVVGVNFISLFALRVLAQRTLQAGLFRPLYPEFFDLTPGYLAVVESVVPKAVFLQVGHGIFLISSMILAALVWSRAYPPAENFRIKAQAISRYFFAGFTVALIILFVLGISSRQAGTEERTLKSRREFPLSGIFTRPDSFAIVKAGSGGLFQGLKSPGFAFTSLAFWLEADSLQAHSDTLFAELSWRDNGRAGQLQAAVVDMAAGESEHLPLYFGKVPAEAKQLQIRFFTLDSTGSAFRVGLFPRQVSQQISYPGLKNPRRDAKGAVELEAIRVEPVDYRLGPASLDPRWQLALVYYRRVPEGWAEAWRVIGSRLTSDPPFLWVYVSIMALLLLGIAGLEISRRRG